MDFVITPLQHLVWHRPGLACSDWVSHDSETQVNSWSVLGSTSCSLITFLIQSETCTRSGVSFRIWTPTEPPRRNRPAARQNLPQRRRAAALVARGGRTREYRAPIGPGSCGAWRLVRAAAFLEGSAEVGSAGAEGSAGGGGRGDGAAGMEAGYGGMS